jgi:hypothetical protein
MEDELLAGWCDDCGWISVIYTSSQFIWIYNIEVQFKKYWQRNWCITWLHFNDGRNKWNICSWKWILKINLINITLNYL